MGNSSGKQKGAKNTANDGRKGKNQKNVPLEDGPREVNIKVSVDSEPAHATDGTWVFQHRIPRTKSEWALDEQGKEGAIGNGKSDQRLNQKQARFEDVHPVNGYDDERGETQRRKKDDGGAYGSYPTQPIQADEGVLYDPYPSARRGEGTLYPTQDLPNAPGGYGRYTRQSATHGPQGVGNRQGLQTEFGNSSPIPIAPSINQIRNNYSDYSRDYPGDNMRDYPRGHPKESPREYPVDVPSEYHQRNLARSPIDNNRRVDLDVPQDYHQRNIVRSPNTEDYRGVNPHEDFFNAISRDRRNLKDREDDLQRQMDRDIARRVAEMRGIHSDPRDINMHRIQRDVHDDYFRQKQRLADEERALRQRAEDYLNNEFPRNKGRQPDHYSSNNSLYAPPPAPSRLRPAASTAALYQPDNLGPNEYSAQKTTRRGLFKKVTRVFTKKTTLLTPIEAEEYRRELELKKQNGGVAPKDSLDREFLRDADRRADERGTEAQIKKKHRGVNTSSLPRHYHPTSQVHPEPTSAPNYNNWEQNVSPPTVRRSSLKPSVDSHGPMTVSWPSTLQVPPGEIGRGAVPAPPPLPSLEVPSSYRNRSRTPPPPRKKRSNSTKSSSSSSSSSKSSSSSSFKSSKSSRNRRPRRMSHPLPAQSQVADEIVVDRPFVVEKQKKDKGRRTPSPYVIKE